MGLWRRNRETEAAAAAAVGKKTGGETAKGGCLKFPETGNKNETGFAETGNENRTRFVKRDFLRKRE